MAKKAQLKAVLTLNNSQFVRTIKHSINLAKDLARQFARSPIQTTFVAGILAARSAVKGTARAVEVFGSTAVRAFRYGAVGATLVAGAMTLIGKSSIHAAADLESFTKVFEVLLGSAEKGSKRMKELLAFANDKGLRLTVVAEASRTLETLTRGALSTAKGLEFVGDIASGTKVEFQEMAVTIGRLFDALRTGGSAGAELARLQELGAITGQARRQIEGLNSVQRGAEAWKLAQQELGRFNGMLNNMSGTWERSMERFKDSIEEAMRQFGTPLMESLKPALSALTNKIFGLEHSFSDLGKRFAKGLSVGINFMVGVFKDPGKIVQPFVDTLKAGMLGVGNVAIAAMKTAVSVLASPAFFSNLGKAFSGLTTMISGQLMLAFQKPVAYFLAGIEKGLELIAKAPEIAMRKAKVLQLDMKLAMAKSDMDDTMPGSTSLLGKMIGNTGDLADPAKFDAASKTFLRLVQEKMELEKNPVVDPRSIGQRADEMVSKGQIAGLGNENIAAGEKLLKEGVDGFFKNMADGLKVFEVKDILGSGAAMEKAKEGIKATAGIGKQMIASIPKPKIAAEASKVVTEISKVVTGFVSKIQSATMVKTGRDSFFSKEGEAARTASFRNQFLRQDQGGRKFGAGSLDQSAVRQGFLLKRAERIQIENDRVAGIQAAGGKDVRRGSGRGHSVVRRGDRQRMQEVQREKLREKEGLDKTNQILVQIQTRFDELTK